MIIRVRSQDLPSFHIEILRHQPCAETLVLEQRKAHSPALQAFLELAQLLPEQMIAQVLVKVVQRGDVRVAKERREARGLDHVHQDEVLAANQLEVPHKIFRQQRIVQRGQKHQQRTTAQAQADERGQLVIIRRDRLRLQGVERIAAGAEMSLAVFGANERFDLIGKSKQSK